MTSPSGGGSQPGTCAIAHVGPIVPLPHPSSSRSVRLRPRRFRQNQVHARLTSEGALSDQMHRDELGLAAALILTAAIALSGNARVTRRPRQDGIWDFRT